ncbi:MAG TPA: hypothetical protein VIP77_17505 [Jiangellaceae bacterium]
MTRLKTLSAALGAGVLALSLTACGGGSDYCDLLKSADEEFGSISPDASDSETMDAMVGKMEEIADAAPSEVSEDWQSLADAFKALAEAGDDPSSIDPEAFGDLDAASTNVSEHAKSECDIEM